MTSPQYSRLRADETELQPFTSPQENDTPPNVDGASGESKNSVAPQPLPRVEDDGKSGSKARRLPANLQHKKRNENTPVSNAWNPGVWARFPWTGLGALALVVALTGAAAAILAVSNGSPVRNWQVRGVTIQPQVWLSVLAALMDGLVLYALIQGAAITFWKRSTHRTKLRNLYDYFEATGLVGALTGVVRGRISVIAVACILASFSALRGPLLQRASIINDRAQLEKTGTMQLRMAQILPPGYLFGEGYIFSGTFTQLYTEFETHADIPFSYPECGDSCKTTLKGFGFSVDCSTAPVSNNDARDGFRAENVTTIGDAVPVFNTSASLYGASDCGTDDISSCFTKNEVAARFGRIEMANLFKAAPDCESDLSVSTCTLRQAIVEYSVVLQSGGISLEHPHWQNDTILSNTSPWDEAESLGYDRIYPYWSSAMNWVNLFNLRFNEEIDRYPDGSLGPASNNLIFRLAGQFVSSDAVNPLNTINCNTTFGDPTQYVIDQMREMAFRTSIGAALITNNTILFGRDSLVAAGLPLIQNWTQTVPYIGRSNQVVYLMSTAYLISSIVVSLLAVVAIIPLYCGWWELGRDVSFNPLEIAKAFDAEILREVDWNMNKDDLVKVVGETMVRYRAVGEDMKRGFEDVGNGG